MKKMIFTFAILLVSILTFAQVPQSFSYQAVVRDRNNAIVSDKYIQVTISILQNSWTVYSEIHNPKTNSNGLFTIEIGNGNSSDNFSTIDWSNGTYFIKTETEYGTTTTQLLSVPFAMYAAKAGNADIDLSDYAKRYEIPVIPDLSGYAKKSDILEISDLSAYVKKSDIPEIPDLSNYAKKSDIPDIPDLSGYAKKSDIPEIPDLAKYAKKSDIPDIPDLSGYAKKSDIPEIPDLAKYAKKSDIPENMSDLHNDANYVEKSYLVNIISALEKRIAKLENQNSNTNQSSETNADNNNNGEGNADVEYVDLGLPSGNLWATCNLGAKRPEEYGGYFSWGEIEPKFYIDDDDIGTQIWNSSYQWRDYKFGQEKNLSKYCTNSSYGNKDDKTTLELSDDAAYVNIGIGWSIPSIDDWNELISNCLCVYAKSYQNTNVQGVILYKYKRNSEGKRVTDVNSYNSYNDIHIFLPYTGFYLGRKFYQNETGYTLDGGMRGMYWSSSLNTESGGVYAQFVMVSKLSAYNYIICNREFIYEQYTTSHCGSKGDRSHGYTIRPIWH